MGLGHFLLEIGKCPPNSHLNPAIDGQTTFWHESVPAGPDRSLLEELKSYLTKDIVYELFYISFSTLHCTYNLIGYYSFYIATGCWLEGLEKG